MKLYSICLFIYATFCLSVHLSKDIVCLEAAASMFWPLWIAAIKHGSTNHSSRSVFNSSGYILTNEVVKPYGNFICFPQQLHHFIYSPKAQRILISSHPPCRKLTLIFNKCHPSGYKTLLYFWFALPWWFAIWRILFYVHIGHMLNFNGGKSIQICS